MNPCPHPDCQAQKPIQMYACRRHWFSLPARIRRRILDGYHTDAALWQQADAEARTYWEEHR